MNSESSFRAFIAVNIPENISQSILSLQKIIKDEDIKCKFVNPSNIHVTLCFLGDIETEMASVLSQNLQNQFEKTNRFSLKVSGLGIFPNTRKPRVIWTGLGGDLGKLRDIKRRIDRFLENKGFESEKREFKPHITLGRFSPRQKVDEKSLLKVLNDNSGVELGEFSVENVVLYRSELTQRGAVYTAISKVELA